MKGIGIYIIFILFITIIIPVSLILGWDIFSDDESVEDIGKKYNIEKIEERSKIEIYNTETKKVENVDFEDYIKGVVAAEMPAEFELEALKAQAVAARTFSLYRMNKYPDGHPDHPETSLCTGIHCQAWLSKESLRDRHPSNWMYEYWPKIEEAVESTKGEIITYEGKPIEPLFHSSSGGMTENSEDVFVAAFPYLRGVESPYEEGTPRFSAVKTMNVNDFIATLKSKYPSVSLSKGNLSSKIKAERTESGRVKRIKVDTLMLTGRDIRTLFGLNSTNFNISLKGDKLEIATKGNGHGVGMSQWGAQGMAEHGSEYTEILKHYYQGVELDKIY